jgi:aldehyde dehydrogenase
MAVADLVKQTSVQQAVDTLRKGGVKSKYENFIGGRWVAPVKGKYFTDYSPINGEPICEIARSSAEDVEKALDAAHAVKDLWGRTAPALRSSILLKIADKMEENLELLALAETLDNGKPIRETRAADVPLSIDHFRYFAGCIRAEEGTVGEIDNDTIAYHFKEPLGVVGQIIPWNFPLLMAAWKLAPAIVAGNCVVIKPASNTPLSLLVLMGLIGDLLPPGVLNVVTGPGGEIGKALAGNSRIAKIGFTGETTTGRLIMQYASEPIIPQTLELGGKSPNIFFADVMDAGDEYFDKALEGFALFAFNKGEVCTCPSRALIQESIFDKFLERAVARVGKIKVGNPLDPSTMMGAQASRDQLDKILDYITIGKHEGARCAIGGEQAHLGHDLENGYYVKPTVFVGHNNAHLPGRDLWSRTLRDQVQGPRRRHRDWQ